MPKQKSVFYISALKNSHQNSSSLQSQEVSAPTDWVLFHTDPSGCAWLMSSKPCFLYWAYQYVWETFFHAECTQFTPWIKTLSFPVEKSTFDLFLTQYARMMRHFDKEQYMKAVARAGFSHIEVNALAFDQPAEKGVPGEFYPDFYTYCPALDQFAFSRLNKGIYPQEYVHKNMERLKDNTRTAARFGLTPGLLCFEPRSVPEEIFRKYPTLRGARIDHPFRSFKPRYTLSTAHPAVKKHYAELLTNIMKQVPELEFLTIWTNDSGAGFEYTKSLYVGRNGGAYLIREWKDDQDIAKAAADNVADFYKTLLNTGKKINPRFRVITRMESFYGERKFLWPKLKNGIDVEIHSLLTKGWEGHYEHPVYPDIKVTGSALQNRLDSQEKDPMEKLYSQKSRPFFFHSFGPHTNHEPLLGIAFPWLTYEKLCAAYDLKIKTLSHLGGINPPQNVPWCVNQEIFRRFQMEPNMDIEKTVSQIAQKYSSPEHSPSLIKGWRFLDLAVRNFPPLSIYSHYGVVWQRLFVRPLVPDISRIPEEERAYYENHMCSSLHNPNKVDLSKDVLFDLISKKYAQNCTHRIDQNVFPSLNKAIEIFSKHRACEKVLEDQYWRARALRCLYETLRNTAVWIYAVHEYLDSGQKSKQSKAKRLLSHMMDREIQNSQNLIEIWEQAPIDWMIVSKNKQTPFIYGNNFPDLMKKRIQLMEKYRHFEPFIDRNFMYKIKNDPY
ncbi:MAG: hypothetical protein GF421_06900 [Candidatus Aminicenantes bacterium]|nr:hypothetical protein [Candidatus Aminicenantes bacterium]